MHGRLFRANARLALFAVFVEGGLAAPSGFPKSGNGLWYTTPGTAWVSDYLPIGNGYLAGDSQPTIVYKFVLSSLSIAMIPGGTSTESSQLNIESLWSGGPFAVQVKTSLNS